MNEVARNSASKSWLERQIKPTTFTEAIAERVMPEGEVLPSQSTLESRVSELYAQSDDAIRGATDIIRQHIEEATDWKFGVRQKVDGRYKAYARTAFFSQQGDGYVIEIVLRGAENVPGLLDRTPVEEDGYGGWVQEGEYTDRVQERVDLLLAHTTNAVVYFTDSEVVERRRRKADDASSELDIALGTYRNKPGVIEESPRTKPHRPYQDEDDFASQRIGYTNVYIGDDRDMGLARVSDEDASHVLRGLMRDRATIIAEEQTAWQEYHEIADRLELDSSLTDHEREKLRARGVDINAMNGLLDYTVGGWRDRFIYNRFSRMERELLEEGYVWDEYAGEAARQALLSPSNHVFMEDRLRIQRGAAAALKALRLTSAESTQNS